MSALYILGRILMGAGGIWVVVLAFMESVGWGLLVLFVPFAGLVFLIKHWEKAKVAFLFQVIGFVLTIVAVVLAPNTFDRSFEHFRELAVARRHDHAPAPDNNADVSASDDEADAGPYTPLGGAYGDTAPSPTNPERHSPASASAHPAIPTQHALQRTGPIRLADAGNYIGARMRVVSTHHIVRVAKLRRVGLHVLVFERDEHGGDITYSMRRKEIAHLVLLGAGDTQ